MRSRANTTSKVWEALSWDTVVHALGEPLSSTKVEDSPWLLSRGLRARRILRTGDPINLKGEAFGVGEGSPGVIQPHGMLASTWSNGNQLGVLAAIPHLEGVSHLSLVELIYHPKGEWGHRHDSSYCRRLTAVPPFQYAKATPWNTFLLWGREPGLYEYDPLRGEPIEREAFSGIHIKDIEFHFRAGFRGQMFLNVNSAAGPEFLTFQCRAIYDARSPHTNQGILRHGEFLATEELDLSNKGIRECDFHLPQFPELRDAKLGSISHFSSSEKWVSIAFQNHVALCLLPASSTQSESVAYPLPVALLKGRQHLGIGFLPGKREFLLVSTKLTVDGKSKESELWTITETPT